MQWYFKYLISAFIAIVCCVQYHCLAQTTTVRPYKFGFTIEEQQHRFEKKDERGIVMGEFGFITADGIYHVTVYATDEQGRFRILAMKNYPYESKPKTVEVLVKPKTPITTTTTTTQKPVLVRHNFNTEACSGCFLKNGNDKPKGTSGVDNQNIKTQIRLLSKVLPSSPELTPKQPGLGLIQPAGTQPKTSGETPAAGNGIKPLKTDTILSPNFNEIRTLAKALNSSAKTTSKQSNLTQVPSQSTLSKLSSKSPITATLLRSKSNENNTKAVFSKVNNGQNNLNLSTYYTTQNVVNVQQHIMEHAPATLSHMHTYEINNAEQYQTQPQILQEFPSTNNHENIGPTNILTGTTTSVIQELKNPLKTKTLNIFHNPHTQTYTKHGNTLNSAESVHTPTTISDIIRNAGIKETPRTIEKPYSTTAYSTVIPTTTNTHTGSSGITHTQTPPTFSIGTNTKIVATSRQQESPVLTTTSNTQTGNTAIMDIIVEKILPTLMSNKGISPTTISNSKPKATPSSNTPGTSKTFIPASNPGSNSISTNNNNNNNKGNSNPSSVNGDGDLYRFKYILDSHGHTETGKRNGNKEGNYFAIGDDDIERTIEYVANENGYQPRIRWRKLNQNEAKAKENTLKEYEFIWFTQ